MYKLPNTNQNAVPTSRAEFSGILLGVAHY